MNYSLFVLFHLDWLIFALSTQLAYDVFYVFFTFCSQIVILIKYFHSFYCYMVDDTFNQFKTKFKKEIDGIIDIDELKELFATEIARRDTLLKELQEQNKLILNSTFKAKKDLLDK